MTTPMSRSSTVLVTGGAGFIGSELVRQLAVRVSRVVVVDNLVNGKRANLDGAGDNVELEVCDVRDEPRVRELVRGVDVVFHLACLGVRHSIHSPVENHEVNATATLGLLALAREAAVKRFVHVSSSEVYGSIDPRPPMSETHHTQPLTVYGASKLAGECYARAFHRTYEYPTVVVRPFNSYGPRSHHEGDCGEVIPKFMLRCMDGQPLVVFGDGSQTRDFTYVADTARGIIMAAECDEAVGSTINLGSGREITVNDLARLVAEVVGREGAPVVHDVPRPGDVPRLLADVTRARQLLGFEPAVSMRQGLTLLKAWYDEQGESPAKALEGEIVRNWERAGSGV